MRDEMFFSLKPGERLDDLERNDYRIIQHPGKFCFGLDAVLLSTFAQAKPEDVVLDLGTGTGIIPILMAAKTKAKRFVALEIQEESADMARRSVEGNGLSDRISILCADLKEADRLLPAASFQVITTNPPYMKGGSGLANPALSKAIARHEIACSLDDVLVQAARLLEPGGRFYMVHRPYRLSEIFAVLKQNRLEPKRMRLVYPNPNAEANLVLIEALRGGKPNLTIERPLIIQDEKGAYTKEVQEVYSF
ncbi:MAG: tRNA1(Val) (adenine(37)-N6)-methyltransferase [Clostridium sp.]|jgi:tRNA1Val (adenine37-N6)-methyltransferase|nr:tRNA1(Val) (adenine(37)-N6)-methyltransferase [Clostridium sp.]